MARDIAIAVSITVAISPANAVTIYTYRVVARDIAIAVSITVTISLVITLFSYQAIRVLVI